MADLSYFNCGDDWEPHTANACFQVNSGMDAAVLFKLGISLADYTTTTGLVTVVDATKIQTLLDAGTAKIVNGLRIGLDAPSAVKADSFVACTPESVVTYDRALTWKDKKVDGAGVIFYNSINASAGFALGGMLIHECAASRITAIDQVMSFTGGRISPEGDELQRFEFTVGWKSKGDANIYADALIWDLVPAAGS